MSRTVLEEIGIDLDKLQEIPLPSDPEEQALERTKIQALQAAGQRFIDARWMRGRLDAVMVRCDWDGAVVPQTAIRGRLVRGKFGVLACVEHSHKTPAEWLEHLLGKKR